LSRSPLERPFASMIVSASCHLRPKRLTQLYEAAMTKIVRFRVAFVEQD
jgi:hypothetical protein